VARHVDKFREVTPLNPKVIGAHMLNFVPDRQTDNRQMRREQNTQAKTINNPLSTKAVYIGIT